MTQAVILAGGKGTRLASRLNGRPKPLIDVDGVPLLRRQIETLAGQGVTHIVLLVNHAADQIANFIAELDPLLSVTLIDDGEPRGTAGATLACLDQLQDRFIVIYGDTLFDVDLAAMLHAHEASGAAASLLLHPNDHPVDSDLVEIDSDGFVRAFHAYPHPPGEWLRNLVNAALYVIERSALEPWAERLPMGDFAKDLFPAMLAEGARIKGYTTFEYIKDVGTPARLDTAERHLRSGRVARSRRTVPQRAVFIDRDGTLNQLRGHIARAEDFELIPGAAAAVRRLNDAEFRVVVLTNQPVIARGEADDAALARIHARLESELGESGAWIDAIYYCPHHPDSGFAGEVTALKRVCDCRKPATGMADAAARDLNIDLAWSWMIGDSTADIAMAQAAGMQSILVGTGEAGRDGKYPAQPHFTATSVAEAIDLIVAASGTLAGSLADVVA